jgi:acetyltransferase-like isoleucine patch superfamily enzyme
VPAARLWSRVSHYRDRARSIAHVRALTLLGYAGSTEVHLGPGVRIINPDAVTLGPMVNLSRDVKIECATATDGGPTGRVDIGDHVFVGERTSIVCHERITIGRLTMIGHNCSLMDFSHGTAPNQSMSKQPGVLEPVTIGEECWLGAAVIVLPGVTIGRGTIVAAGAVVSRDLPENVVAAGVPARVMRAR